MNQESSNKGGARCPQRVGFVRHRLEDKAIYLYSFRDLKNLLPVFQRQEISGTKGFLPS